MTVTRHKAHLGVTPSSPGSDPSLPEGCHRHLGRSSPPVAALNGSGAVTVADTLRQFGLGTAVKRGLSPWGRNRRPGPCSPRLAQTQHRQQGPWGRSPVQGLPLTPRLGPPEALWATLPSLLYRVGPAQPGCFPLLPVCRQLPRCLKVTKVQEASWECVTFQRGVTLGRRRGEGAAGALKVGLALSAASSRATQGNDFFSLGEASSSVAEAVAAQ